MNYRRLLVPVIVTFLLAISCQPEKTTEYWPPDLYVEGIPVSTRSSGPLLEDEVEALTLLGKGLVELGYMRSDVPCVIFIRTPEQKVPEMCGSDGCCDRWNECPDALGAQERVEGEGFSGLQRGDHVFVSRIGDRARKLKSLLAHEFAHWVCDCEDGDPMLKAIETELKETM